MTIELSKARKGDRFEARDGEVWTYAERNDADTAQPHTLISGDRATVFDDSGHYWSSRRPSDDDLIRALGIPAPEAGADAELVRRRDLELIDNLRNPMWVHCSVGEPELDKETVVPDMELAATRIDALTRALEEAGKVIAPLARRCAEVDGVKIVARFARDGSAQVDLPLLRAARDWVTKHGGGDA